MKNKILFVGGNWDLNGGKCSKIVSEFANYLPDVTVFNGGNYNDLNKILESCINYDIIIWWANVPNELPKIRIEFTKANDLYIIKLFDPLGNVWYEGTNIQDCSKQLLDRLNFIKSITRESTVSSEENNGALSWFFNMFKEEMYKSNDNPTVPIKNDFLSIVKNYASKFAEATFETKDVKRFLGNASFRCPKGFPSFRDGKYIFVSKRNVNKEYISIEEFVPVYLENGKIHSHCYIEGAPFTQISLPCGAIEEVDEILNVLKKYYNNDFYKDFYLINLIGHGSIMMSNNPEQLKNIKMIGRKLPENMYKNKTPRY